LELFSFSFVLFFFKTFFFVGFGLEFGCGFCCGSFIGDSLSFFFCSYTVFFSLFGSCSLLFGFLSSFSGNSFFLS